MREKLTFANVMSVAAVFIALGGSAVALKANSVGSRQIKNDSVKGWDVSNSSLKGKDLKEASISAREIEEGAFDLEPFFEMKSQQLGCDPNSSAFVTCNNVRLGLEEPSQALLVAGGGQTGGGDGTCKFLVDGVNEPIAATPGFPDSNGFGLTAVTQPTQLLPPGSHTFELVCNETSGNAAFSTTLSVVALGGDG